MGVWAGGEGRKYGGGVGNEEIGSWPDKAFYVEHSETSGALHKIA